MIDATNKGNIARLINHSVCYVRIVLYFLIFPPFFSHKFVNDMDFSCKDYRLTARLDALLKAV